MNKMVERVAAAIMRANFSREVEIQGINVSVPDNLDLARAAIEAMREFTPEMEKEGFFANLWIDPSDPQICVNISSIAAYHAMIDIALKD